jgi:hypothetical protein
MAWADFDDTRLLTIYTQALVATHPEAKNDILPLRAEILDRLEVRRCHVQRLIPALAKARRLCFVLGCVALGMGFILLETWHVGR